MKPKIIEEIHAWVAIGDDGDEGVIAARFGDAWVPLIGADAERLLALRPFAEDAAVRTGRTVRLKKFSSVETVEEIVPDATATGV